MVTKVTVHCFLMDKILSQENFMQVKIFFIQFSLYPLPLTSLPSIFPPFLSLLPFIFDLVHCARNILPGVFSLDFIPTSFFSVFFLVLLFYLLFLLFFSFFTMRFTIAGFIFRRGKKKKKRRIKLKKKKKKREIIKAFLKTLKIDCLRSFEFKACEKLNFSNSLREKRIPRENVCSCQIVFYSVNKCVL